MWPFDQEKTQLATLLGSAAARWLDGAEIVAWTPDPNYKPQAYFVARDMSEQDFRNWAATLDLSVSDSPAVPSGVFVLPAGVEIGRWLPPADGSQTGLDGHGTTSRATRSSPGWSCWRAGVTYSAVRPTL